MRECGDRCLPHGLQRGEASAVGEEVPETGRHCLLHLGLREVAISLHLNMLTSWDNDINELVGIFFCQRSFDKGLQVGKGYATENNLC